MGLLWLWPPSGTFHSLSTTLVSPFVANDHTSVLGGGRWLCLSHVHFYLVLNCWCALFFDFEFSTLCGVMGGRITASLETWTLWIIDLLFFFYLPLWINTEHYSSSVCAAATSQSVLVRVQRSKRTGVKWDMICDVVNFDQIIPRKFPISMPKSQSDVLWYKSADGRTPKCMHVPLDLTLHRTYLRIGTVSGWTP